MDNRLRILRILLCQSMMYVFADIAHNIQVHIETQSRCKNNNRRMNMMNDERLSSTKQDVKKEYK